MGNQRLLVHLDTRSSNQIERRMSWQSYVDEQLIASGMVTAAAIAGHDGNIWAKSNGFNASPDEVKRLLSNWGPNLAMGGVTVNTFKYMFLSSNEKVVRGKKGSSGVHIYKTSQAVIIACYSEPIVAEQCAVTTEKLVTTWCLSATKGTPFYKRQLVLL